MSPWIAGWAIAPCIAAAGWLGSLRRLRPAAKQEQEAAFELGRTPISAEALDLGAILDVVLRRADRDRARLLASVQVAVPDDLQVYADRRALHHALSVLIRTALDGSPASTILVTAREHAKRVVVSVVAEGRLRNGASLRAELRDVETIAAMHGGSTELEAQEHGTVIRLRLPEVVARASETRGSLVSIPAQASPAAEPAAQPGNRRLLAAGDIGTRG